MKSCIAAVCLYLGNSDYQSKIDSPYPEFYPLTISFLPTMRASILCAGCKAHMAETRGQHSNNWRAQEHYGWVSLLLMLLLLAVCETAQARPGLPLLRSSYSQLQQALLNATSLASQPQSAARKLAQSGLSSIESSPDDRTESPVRQYPFNTVGLILLRFSDDSTGACTGALVGPTYVLTAGHCLVDPGTGANVVEAQFVPGYDTNSGISAPYGIAKLTDWAVPQVCKQHQPFIHSDP